MLTPCLSAVILSLAGSKHTLPLQFAFLSMNGIGVLLATIYNASTPDLYPNNAHHKIGWIITWVVSAHVLLGLTRYVASFVSKLRRKSTGEASSFIPTHRPLMQDRRWSTDSGQGTEPSSAGSSRNESVSSYADFEDVPQKEEDFAVEDNNVEQGGRFVRRVAQTALARKLVTLVSYRVWRYMNVGYNVVDRIIMPFGFIAFTTGIVTYARFFVSSRLYVEVSSANSISRRGVRSLLV